MGLRSWSDPTENWELAGIKLGTNESPIAPMHRPCDLRSSRYLDVSANACWRQLSSSMQKLAKCFGLLSMVLKDKRIAHIQHARKCHKAYAQYPQFAPLRENIMLKPFTWCIRNLHFVPVKTLHILVADFWRLSSVVVRLSLQGYRHYRPYVFCLAGTDAVSTNMNPRSMKVHMCRIYNSCCFRSCTHKWMSICLANNPSWSL
jgi:hypothetical protein